MTFFIVIGLVAALALLADWAINLRRANRT